MARTYQVALASIEIDGLFAVDAETLGTSWVPGTTHTRYSREWRLSRPEQEEEGARWFGRIGFVKPGELTTLAWDADQMDFVEGVAPGGVVVPFVVDLDSAVIAYQLRAGLVRGQTFTGALESLLNVEGTHKWRVSPLVFRRSYEAWKDSVERVTSFSFRLELPNPDWVDRPLVEDIVGELDTEWTRLSGVATEGGSIDTNADLFRQALDHTLNRGYGHARLEGRDAQGNPSEWRAVKELGGVIPAATRVEAESDEMEVPKDSLSDALGTLTDRMEAIAEVDVPDDENAV